MKNQKTVNNKLPLSYEKMICKFDFCVRAPKQSIGNVVFFATTNYMVCLAFTVSLANLLVHRSLLAGKIQVLFQCLWLILNFARHELVKKLIYVKQLNLVLAYVCLTNKPSSRIL